MIDRPRMNTMTVLNHRPPPIRQVSEMREERDEPLKTSVSKISQLADHKERMLMQRVALHRDQAALEQLYATFRPRVYGFLQRLTKDSALIDDTYNEVMYLVWSKASQFSGQSKVSSWVFTIAYRTCLNLLKRQTQQQRLQEQLEINDDHSSADLVRQLEQERMIENALRKVAPKQRMVLELNYFMGFSLPEIAEITHSGLNTVKARLRYARHRLRSVVELMELEQSPLSNSAETENEHGS